MANILYVIGSLDVGGAEQHLAQVAPALKRRGWEVEIYCLGKRGVLADQLEREKVRVSCVPLTARTKMTLLYRVSRIIVAAAAFTLFLLRRRPTIVHFFLPGAYIIGGPCAFLARIKIRLMSRRSLNDYQANSPLAARIERALHRTLTAAFGNSAAVVKQLEEEGIPQEKLFLIYNGVDCSRFDEPGLGGDVRRMLGVFEESLVFIIVANLIPYKGHRDLLTALAQSVHGLPSDWKLLVVGRDDSIGGELRAQSESLGIADHVHWLGSRSDVPALLRASDIGILCSHEEGFSNAIIEAMAAALPMIVTDVGGNTEAVVDGVTGLVVPVRDPDRLAVAILTLASDPARREKGEAGRMRVVRHFSRDNCINQYVECYTTLLTKSS